MGRGSSKVGSSKVGSSNVGAMPTAITEQTVKSLSDVELDTLDKGLQSKLAEKNDQLATIAKENSPQNMPDYYYDVKKQQTVIKDNLREVGKEKARRKAGKSSSTSKTSVNSFGEATKREITTASYKRQQKKLSQQLMRFIGG